MSAFLCEELLGDEEMWRPRVGHVAVELVRDKSGQYAIKQKSLLDKDIESWARNEDEQIEEGREVDRRVVLRLLICSPRILDQNISPFPISKKTFAFLQKNWSIPSSFLRAICRQTPTANIFRKGSVNGLCLRTNLSWQWQYALAVCRAETQNGITNAILLGLRAPEIANLLSSLRNGLNDGIQQLHLWLPTLLLDLSIDDLTRDAEIQRTALLRICHSTGVHAFRVDNTITSDEYKHNIRELTRKLTALCDACAGIRAVTTTQERFINVVNEFAKLDWALQNHWSDDLDFASNLLQGVKSKMAYVTESSQGQIQAMNSLIAQEDSAIHARYADLSGRIADHSQKIAEFTRRDSIDMRSVSVLMMAFFPATFLATLFSSSFFNFQPREGDRVSRWIWLYCTICIVLTSCSWAAWVLFRRLKDRKPDNTFRSNGWSEEIDIAEKGKTREPKDHDNLPPLRPYLSGSIPGLKFQDNDIEEFFQKEVPIGNTPKTDLQW